jgi:hypothetical protein
VPAPTYGFIVLVFVIPLAVFALNTFIKYPFEEQGSDKAKARKEFLDDLGIDFYFAVLVSLVSITLDKLGPEVTLTGFTPILLYILVGPALARCYRRAWATRLYHSPLPWGIIVGTAALLFSIYLAST